MQHRKTRRPAAVLLLAAAAALLLTACGAGQSALETAQPAASAAQADAAVQEQTHSGAEAAPAEEQQAVPEATGVPVLVYHHLDETGNDSTTISVTKFRAQLELLRSHGYTPVSLQALLDYVQDGTPLPEKPVVLTFDDGYYSNYEYAFPLLQEFQYPAAIFVIGSSFGHMQYYKDTTNTLTPHFGAQEAEEMLASGLITLQSHTYDLHQWPPFETGTEIRENMLPLETDTPEQYEALVTADLAGERELLASVGVPEVFALAYPEGEHTAETDRILSENGIVLTFTFDPEPQNILIPGDESTLRNLGRKNICEATTDEELLAYLEQKSG